MTVATRTNQPITVWRPRGFDGMVFYRGVQVTHPYPRHWHDEWHMCLYTAGAGNLGYKGNSWRVVCGDFVLTPPGEVHENSVDGGRGVSYCSLYLDAKALSDAMSRLGEEFRLPHLPLFNCQDVRLKRKFLYLYRSMQEDATQLQCDEALIELLAALLHGRSNLLPQPTDCSDNGKVRDIQAYIGERFSGTISLAELGRAAGMSPYHLHHLFCRQTGMPPHAYQTQVRVNRAKALLRAGWPCCDVAMTTGFADQSHFHRRFQRLVGVSPGRYAADFSSACARTFKTA
jgi:AraC-like DNA-binding protein